MRRTLLMSTLSAVLMALVVATGTALEAKQLEQSIFPNIRISAVRDPSDDALDKFLKQIRPPTERQVCDCPCETGPKCGPCQGIYAPVCVEDDCPVMICIKCCDSLHAPEKYNQSLMQTVSWPPKGAGAGSRR